MFNKYLSFKLHFIRIQNGVENQKQRINIQALEKFKTLTWKTWKKIIVKIFDFHNNNILCYYWRKKIKTNICYR